MKWVTRYERDRDVHFIPQPADIEDRVPPPLPWLPGPKSEVENFGRRSIGRSKIHRLLDNIDLSRERGRDILGGLKVSKESNDNVYLNSGKSQLAS